jgi:hypothetical protein
MAVVARLAKRSGRLVYLISHSTLDLGHGKLTADESQP